MNEILAELLAQEAELQFDFFNENTAWQIGSWLVAHATAEELPVTIDIRRGEHLLFHASRPGTSADNDVWVMRKVRLVNRTCHNSFYWSRFFAAEGKSIEDVLLLPESEYAPHGGCFPIIVKNTGMVGTITVSGLPQEEDHKLVIKALTQFLKEG